MSEWHCVYDEVPADHREVLVTIERPDGSRVVLTDCYNPRERLFDSELEDKRNGMGHEYPVVAWMDMPEPFEEVEPL